MRKGWLFIFILIIPSISFADPSLSSKAGRSSEDSQASTMKRDKSLSAEKARGNRATDSDSREHAREVSRSKGLQTRQSISSEISDSYSADVNINGLLLREFTSRYERSTTGRGLAWTYFNACKPLMNAVVDYPVWNLTEGGVTGRVEAMHTQSRYVATRGDGVVQPSPDPSNRFIARYAQCRMTASYWLSTAGDRTTRQQVTSEEEIRDRIRNTFQQMDLDESLFIQLRQRARDIWANAICSNWLDDYQHFQSPNLECGVFSFIGQNFTVENRETLSEAGINGRSYKVAVSAQASQSASVDDTESADARVSYAEREGDSRERYREARKSASLSKSTSRDSGMSSKVDSSAGNDISATPHK